MNIAVNGQDYTAVLADTPALEITRTLNKPQQCSWSLDLAASSLPVPTRNQNVIITADNGTVLFTGFVVSDAVQELLGQTTSGPLYRTHCAAWSMDYALDRQPLPWLGSASGGFNQAAGTLLAAITARLNTEGIAADGLSGGPTVGSFHPEPGTTWSHNAGQLASQARSAYRVHDATITLAPVGTVTHTLDGSVLQLGGIQFKSARVLANDVAVTGDQEPDCYVLDMFQGDGATTVFNLTQEMMHVTAQKVLNDAFTLADINRQTWQINDPGSHFSLASGGLACAGGTGSDGQTTLSAIDLLELGGTLVLEAGNVNVAAGSTGIVLGAYSGIVNLADCFVGFHVRSTGGALVLAALVNGQEVGTLFTLAANHNYLLRVRLHFPELIRSLATYYSLGENGVLARGGGLVNSACSVEFELQDSAAAVDTPATVLYDGAIASTPATATFCAVNSTNLSGTFGYFSITRPSTAWVTSVPLGSTERTRRIGTAVQGAECKVTGGKLTFYTAATPAAGELIKLRYRTQQRAVARLANTASQQQESANQPTSSGPAVPGTAQWAGRVGKPVARCAADCEAAAQAVLDFAANTDAAWEARVAGANLHQLTTGDVWPGDTVTLDSTFAGTAPALMVRTVTVRNQNGSPELLQYELGLANEWADCLSLTLESTPAADALLPVLPAAAANAVAANLPLADVTALTATSITIAANATPPAGGGFEVRQQDAGFGNGTQPGLSVQGLVLRSAVGTFTLPRAAQQEQWFVRMYDGSTPPLYSRVSAAIFTNVPLT